MPTRPVEDHPARTAQARHLCRSVWFDQAVTGRSCAEIGIPTTPDRSFSLTRSDTIASVQAAHRQRCELSRQTMAALSLDDVVDGRGRRLVWAIAAACTPRARTARRARRHPPEADPRPTRPLTCAQAELKQIGHRVPPRGSTKACTPDECPRPHHETSHRARNGDHPLSWARLHKRHPTSLADGTIRSRPLGVPSRTTEVRNRPSERQLIAELRRASHDIEIDRQPGGW